ncbi:hypothetical protein ACFQU7_36380 [Pseudoroseomonas wenyumeiae]
MSMIHDRKHAQKYLTRIGSGATLAFAASRSHRASPCSTPGAHPARAA